MNTDKTRFIRVRYIHQISNIQNYSTWALKLSMTWKKLSLHNEALGGGLDLFKASG